MTWHSSFIWFDEEPPTKEDIESASNVATMTILEEDWIDG